MQENYANGMSELERIHKRTGNCFRGGRIFHVQRTSRPLILSAVLLTTAFLVMNATTSQSVQISFAANTNTTQSVLTYQNSTYGVSIKYPSNWGVQAGINTPSDTIIDVTDFSPPIAADPNAVANFQIGAENLGPSDTRNLDLDLRNAINGYRFNATNFHIDLATTTNTQLAGRPAYVLVFSDTYNHFPMKTLVMGTFGDKHGDDNGRAYYVQYTAEASRYDQLLPPVHQMINSFELSDQAENIMHAINTTEQGSSS